MDGAGVGPVLDVVFVFETGQCGSFWNTASLEADARAKRAHV
jgi:hypothetical protein